MGPERGRDITLVFAGSRSCLKQTARPPTRSGLAERHPGPDEWSGFVVIRSKLGQPDVFEEPDLDKLMFVTLVAKPEPVSSCHSVSHGLLLGLPLLRWKREPLTNNSPLCVGPNHGLILFV